MQQQSRKKDWLYLLLGGKYLEAGDYELKKSVFVGLGSAALVVLGINTFLFFLPVKLTTIIQFGWAIWAQMVMALLVLPLLRKYIMEVSLLTNILTILIAFAFILKLGGFMHSAGLIFVGLTVVTGSLGYRRLSWSIGLYLLFMVTTVASALLQPYLTVPPEMTPAVNLAFFTFNFAWIATYISFYAIYQFKAFNQLERQEAERQRELNETKTKLYTNITHEFRTPLTIILGMARLAMESNSKRLESSLKLILRNGNILLNLVNQMLDLQKVETRLFPVHPVQSDIIAFLSEIVRSFKVLAEEKSIKMDFQSQIQELTMDYDPGILQKICYNLFSNALKFTPEGGQVLVKIKEDHSSEMLEMEVRDTGVGISDSDATQVFERFFQVDGSKTRKAGGTGIGLALTRDLVHLLEGSITLESKIGQGSSFFVRLPIRRNAALGEDHGSMDTFQLPELLSTLEGKEPQLLDHAPPEAPVVLIVEDTADMVHYLLTCLEGNYHLLVAADGKAGLEMAKSEIPDLILTDVMMPEMDGMEMSRQLKKDFRTSHIPIIMLTAKADLISKIQGLETGADAYLTKPFYREELLVRIQNLIQMRRDLRQHFLLTEPIADLPELETMDDEQLFLTRVRRIILEKLADDSFGVDELAREMMLSRTQLYRKFMALTDFPVGKFIRTIRLNKAKKLLENSSMNVTEVAFECGFKNLSHFSAAFKDEFEVTPSEIHLSRKYQNIRDQP